MKEKKEREKSSKNQYKKRCLIFVWELSTLGISRTWRTQTVVVHNVLSLRFVTTNGSYEVSQFAKLLHISDKKSSHTLFPLFSKTRISYTCNQHLTSFNISHPTVSFSKPTNTNQCINTSIKMEKTRIHQNPPVLAQIPKRTKTILTCKTKR